MRTLQRILVATRTIVLRFLVVASLYFWIIVPIVAGVATMYWEEHRGRDIRTSFVFLTPFGSFPEVPPLPPSTLWDYLVLYAASSGDLVAFWAGVHAGFGVHRKLCDFRLLSRFALACGVSTFLSVNRDHQNAFWASLPALATISGLAVSGWIFRSWNSRTTRLRLRSGS